jgi:hypothetical protein
MPLRCRGLGIQDSQHGGIVELWLGLMEQARSWSQRPVAECFHPLADARF